MTTFTPAKGYALVRPVSPSRALASMILPDGGATINVVEIVRHSKYYRNDLAVVGSLRTSMSVLVDDEPLMVIYEDDIIGTFKE